MAEKYSAFRGAVEQTQYNLHEQKSFLAVIDEPPEGDFVCGFFRWWIFHLIMFYANTGLSFGPTRQHHSYVS
ncbi:MAG: hypothetical protein NVSMB6_18350 [Burkholderiaceae bacterium]